MTKTTQDGMQIPLGSDVASTPHRQYQPYLEAVWGFKNHWYPALFSHELTQEGLQAIRIAGVPILLRRVDGEVFAVRDQCLHRGVQLSARPLCLTEDTVTCWYHGFTYGVRDGKLRTIVAAPDDELIGKVGIQTFPVREVNEMIFVFVGDEGFEPLPDIAEDLPSRIPADKPQHVAYPLDPDTMLLGIRRVASSNWRLAVENGFDPGHLLMHRDCTVVLAHDIALPLGINPNSPEAIQVIEDDNGPKGISNEYEGGHYDLVLENELLGLRAQGGQPLPGLRTSMYVPGVLMVESWPQPGMTQYEWYVPIDDKTHMYWEVLARRCTTPDERARFAYECKHVWREEALFGFNNHDVFAREQMENFYSSDGGPGWEDEQLCAMDAVIVGWRKLAARYNRGIQTPQAHPSPRC